jgi:hypothetical protein
MPYDFLAEPQKKEVAERLSSAVINKDTPHENDLQRAAVIIYDVCRYGYLLNEDIILEILNKSGEWYSEDAKEWLGHMAFGIAELVSALNDAEYSRSRIDKAEFDALSGK